MRLLPKSEPNNDNVSKTGNRTAARPEGVHVELTGNGRYDVFESSMLPNPQLEQ
jgi:hypothetical protein